MTKWYNPLKPHIVQLYDGRYAVRTWRLAYLGWGYFDNQRYGRDQYWWPAQHVHKWAAVATLDDARELLKKALFASCYDTGKYIEG